MAKLFTFLAFLLIFQSTTKVWSISKHRLIVLTDIEADPDDTQSLIRLLLYSNTIDIKGLIATTSVHQKTFVAPESILKIIQAYGKVQPNLEKHEKGFPLAENLQNIVKQGLATYGMEGVGDKMDSPGSDWIIKVLEEKDDRPLWVTVWGGSNTLAQALYKISKTKSPADARKLYSKLRVYTISDQDDSGIWIRKNFPGIFYIVSPGGYGHATWLGMNLPVKGINNETISNTWISENLQKKHGPLGVLYPDVAYGMEGDTPSWLALIPNGINEPEHPDWGGWGGRYEYYQPEYATLDIHGFNGGVPIEPEPHAIWTNAIDKYSPYLENDLGRAVRQDTLVYIDNKATVWRWRDDFQNDFAARMDWCIRSYEEANHPPVPSFGHPDHMDVKSGQIFTLDASGSSDPDGDHLSYLWFSYPEAGSCKTPIKINAAENLWRISLTAPKVTKPETVHMILKVSDNGSPVLSRYKRMILSILPD